MLGKIIVFLSCNLILATAQMPCCKTGPNALRRDKVCLDGSEMDPLACKFTDMKVIIEANTTETRIDERGYLVFFDDNEDAVSPDQYCFTNMEGEKIYISCYEDEVEASDREGNIRMLINVILSLISVFFIILTIAVYLSIPELLDHQGICLIWAISGLALSFVALAIIDLSYYLPDQYCLFLAYLMYTAFMFAFFWLHVLCFHIWKMIVNPNILRFTKRWLLIYHIFGISGPIILLFFVLVANHSGFQYFDDIHPGIGQAKCWFIAPTVTFIYFYGPVSVLLCINIVYFIWTTKVLWHQMKNCSETKTKVLKYRLLLCVKLFFVMGLPWCFEIVSASLEGQTSEWIWILPDACNALQGLLIFLLLVVFRKKAMRALASKKSFSWLKLPASWRNLQDEEFEELEEEISLSGVDETKTEIPH